MDQQGAVADYTKENHGEKGPHFSCLHYFDDSTNDTSLRNSKAFSNLFTQGRHDLTSVLWSCHAWRLGLAPVHTRHSPSSSPTTGHSPSTFMFILTLTLILFLFLLS